MISIQRTGDGFHSGLFTHMTSFDVVQYTLGKVRQQGIEQGFYSSVSLTRPVMMLFLSNDSSLEISSWKPSASFVNWNGRGIILPSEEIATTRSVYIWQYQCLQILFRLNFPFIKSDTMMSIIDYHCRLDGDK